MYKRQVHDLIATSGNTLHKKVTQLLKSHGWRVTVSPYYLDQVSEKAREIDLIAEKTWPYGDQHPESRGSIAIRLFIECKYIPNETVFWFAEKDSEAALRLVCSTGLFRKSAYWTGDHHYLSGSSRVAKLFESRGKKSGGGGGNQAPPESDPFYKALNQVLNGMIYLRESSVTRLRGPQSHEQVTHVLDFPVIACNSFANFYAVNLDCDDDPAQLANRFLLEVQYAYRDRSGARRDDYYLVDVVDSRKIEDFLSALDTDAEIAIAEATD